MSYVSVPTRKGNICANGFGIGVELSGTYTSSEILNTAFSLEKMVEEKSKDPEWCDVFNSHFWVPWDRLTHEYCNALTRRVQLSTAHGINPSDFDNYLGFGSYVASWPLYISTADRLSALTQAFRNLNGLNVYEVGCGTGHQLLQLASYGCNVGGMELNPVLYNSRHQLLSNKVEFGDALFDPWMLHSKNEFDVVIISMVGFVRFEDLIELFCGIEHILNRTGVLIVDIPKHQKSCGNVRQSNSYYSSLKTAGFSPKRLFADQLICTKQG